VLSDLELRDELVTMLVAGHETTASTNRLGTARAGPEPQGGDRRSLDAAGSASGRHLSRPWSFKPERFSEKRPSSSEWFPFGGRCGAGP
jgi:cytochrome P450